MNIEQLRAALANPNLTEEQAPNVLASLVTENKSLKAATAPLPADMLAQHYDLAVEKIDLAVKGGTLPAVVANTLKTDLGTRDKPNAYLLTPTAALGNKRPIDNTLALFAASKDAGETPEQGVQSGRVQRVERTIPGREDEEDKKAAESGDNAYRSYARTTYGSETPANGNGHK